MVKKRMNIQIILNIKDKNLFFHLKFGQMKIKEIL